MNNVMWVVIAFASGAVAGALYEQVCHTFNLDHHKKEKPGG